jgi:hypothetical protein
MTEPLRPSPAATLGRENWYYVPAGGFADYKAPTATELAAASVLDFTRMAMSDGTTAPSRSTDRAESLRRLGDDATYEVKGVTKYAGGTLTYATNPQAVAASDGKKAWEKFLDGPDGGFLVRRLNVERAIAPTTGQFVSVFPSDLSESLLTTAGSGSAGEVVGECDYFIRETPKQMVALA